MTNWLCFFKLVYVECRYFEFRASCFGFPAVGRRLALIGFVFSPPQSIKIFITTYYIGTYAHSALSKIGFVFSNGYKSIRHMGIRAKGTMDLLPFLSFLLLPCPFSILHSKFAILHSFLSILRPAIEKSRQILNKST